MHSKQISNIVVGIDASRNRSGGAIAHVEGIIGEGNPFEHGIREVHVWAYKALLDKLPDRTWLIKHNPRPLEKTIFHQLWWQLFSLAREAKEQNCDVLFCTDASSFCRFRPLVVMSQDMLQYEPGAIRSFRIGKAWLRQKALLLVQNRALRFADGVIFLSQYAARTVQEKTGKLKNTKIIPHGISHGFEAFREKGTWPTDSKQSIKCLYVSPVLEYKHQWNVVRAIAILRQRGIEITLLLVGGGNRHSLNKLRKQIKESDPHNEFVNYLEFVPQEELLKHYANSDVFVFASSCENLPITLLEAMATGIPIACSDRGPMPDVLQGGGVYFNPEDPISIASAVERIINKEDLRSAISKRAKELTLNYSWQRCASETWSSLADIFRDKTWNDGSHRYHGRP
jgi:glycosyltransferase involved in cell wall biosynthesis